MIGFIDKYLTQRQDRKIINFAEILEKREKLIVIFPASPLINYQIMQYIATWKDFFRKFEFVFEAYESPFFDRIISFDNFEIIGISEIAKSNENCVVISLKQDTGVRKILSKLDKSIVIDIENQGNLQFLPDTIDLKAVVKRFSEFTNLPFRSSGLTFKFTKSDAAEARYNFFQNRFNNIILDLNKPKFIKTVEELIVFLKQNFPANVYLTGKMLKKNPFISVRNYRPPDLLKLYNLAAESDLFLTDDPQKYKLMSYFNINQFCLQEEIKSDKSGYINPFDLVSFKKTLTKFFSK